MTDVSEVQFWKASYSIVLTPSGIVTDVRALHPLKASELIKKTLSGIVMDSREVQFRKVQWSI